MRRENEKGQAENKFLRLPELGPEANAGSSAKRLHLVRRRRQVSCSGGGRQLRGSFSGMHKDAMRGAGQAAQQTMEDKDYSPIGAIPVPQSLPRHVVSSRRLN